MSKTLTPEQQVIAAAKGLQVLTACPGAGKTTVVGFRLASLVAEVEKTGSGGVAAITFTNAAAEEIRKVYREITGHSLAPPHYVGTIDSFLLQYIFHPFGHLVLGDPAKPAELVPPHSGLLNILYQGFNYTALHKVRSKAKYTYDATGNITPASAKPELQDAVAKMKRDMKVRNLATVSDAAYWALITLRQNTACCHALIRRFPFIMIDEAQDCSDVQMAIVDELVAQGHTELMLIGDVFQAIYEFRDAVPKLLQEKKAQIGWNSMSLTTSHRCRPGIVDFINQTAVASDPAVRYMTAAKHDCPGVVKVLDEKKPSEIAQAFLSLCNVEGITPSEISAAILYGSHGSDLSRARITRDDVQGLFAQKQRELHAALPSMMRFRLLGQNAEALKEAMELVYQLKLNKSSHQAKRDGDDCSDIEALRPVVWKFCKSLPDCKLSFNDWVSSTNAMIPHFLASIGCTTSFVITINRQVKKEQRSQTLRTFIIGQSDYATGLPLTITNVHQVKGRTFQGVLVYLDPGTSKTITGSKLTTLLRGKRAFAKMTEDDRCIYVGISRAEKLLCFAGDVGELKKVLAQPRANKPAVKPHPTAKQQGLAFFDEAESDVAALA